MLTRPAVATSTPSALLLKAARTYGTPLYLYDLGILRDRVSGILSVLSSHIDLLYSLKANPSLAICEVLARLGLGADVASAGELVISHHANFDPAKIMVAAPHKCQDLLSGLRSTPETLLSLDSISEFETLAGRDLQCRCLLRLRPESPESSGMSAFSRFGITYADLSHYSRKFLASGIRIVGFHIYSGSQFLDTTHVIRTLQNAFDLCSRAADQLGIVPDRLSLGGGFGIPYAKEDQELNLERIADELGRLAERIAPARISLELGRYLVGPCGWYLTSVVATQSCNGHPAVVVDGGVHHRADICGLNLRSRGGPPIVLESELTERVFPTDVLGCLCLPSDILASACLLPMLAPGKVLAFSNSGAYGLSAAPVAFLGHASPPEIAVDGEGFSVLRPGGFQKTF